MTQGNGDGATLVADPRPTTPLRGDPRPANTGGSGALPAGSVHDRGARGDGAPLGGGPARRPGSPVPGGLAANGRLDDDRDTSRALAAARRGRISVGAGPGGEADIDRLTIAVPVKGRLREPAVSLLVDAGLGPEQPGERALAF